MGLSRRGVLVAGMVAALAVSVVAIPAAGAGYSAQSIEWAPCFGPQAPPPSGVPPEVAARAECGTFRAPRDWHHPGAGADIDVAVTRLRPLGTYRGTVFTNPGGPGSAGRKMPLKFIARRPAIAEHMELVGIDVRGSDGDGTPLSCAGDDPNAALSLDPRDRGRANLDRIYDAYQRHAAACQTDGLAKFVNTEQTVRDLDLLRSILGRRTIDYIGYSAGTWLGAYYTAYFPEHVGRFVLDSNMDVTAGQQGNADNMPMGFERRFRLDFLPWVAANDATYRLGTDAEQVRRSYERIRAALPVAGVATTRPHWTRSWSPRSTTKRRSRSLPVH